MTKNVKNFEKMIFTGKRKTAVSKLRVKPGSGKVFFNHLDHNELGLFHRLALTEPLRIYVQELEEELK